MCRFKSGIILKSKVVVAPGENDSHSDLLDSLGIEDNYIGASKVFVSAERGSSQIGTMRDKSTARDFKNWQKS